MPVSLIVLIGVALIYDFFNGYNDSSSIVATMIFSRAVGPRWALLITAIGEFIGPFLFGLAVARTIGRDIAAPEAVNMYVLIAAMVSAILWTRLTFYLAIPSSTSHALIGGLVGAVWAAAGLAAVGQQGVTKALLALLLSPLLGGLVGFLIMRLITFLARNASMRINWFFKRAQVATVFLLALSHGSNDGQKTIGVITLALVVSGVLPEFRVPFWVILVSAAGMGLGALSGGWKLIRTIGGKFYRIRPVDGFASQLASALIVFGAGLVGGPVSGTQVISSAILGVGAAERVNKIRWNVAVQIVLTWVITIPAAALVAAGLYKLLALLF